MSLVDHPYLGPPLLTGARRGGLSQELAATHAEELEAARSRAADLERLLQAASPRIGGVSRAEMLAELSLSQYASAFEEEEMTSIELLEDIVSRGDGEKELMDALKEMGIKKMGHRQAIVGAVVGKL